MITPRHMKCKAFLLGFYFARSGDAMPNLKDTMKLVKSVGSKYRV